MRQLLLGLFVAVHASVLVLFVAGLLGRYVNPHAAWWLQPFAIALPATALVVVILTPIAAGLRLWVPAVAGAVLLIVFALRYIDAANGGKDLEGEALTVLTFNSGGGEEGRERGLQGLLADEEPELACLQEFPVRHPANGLGARAQGTMNQLLESMGYDVVAPRPPDGHRGPPPIFSRLDLERSSVLGLSSRRERDQPGTVVRAQFSWQGRSFAVYNVHLASFTTRRPWTEGNTFNVPAWFHFFRRTSESFLQRADESIEIRRMLDGEDLPFLLCGDFNTTPHQWTYTRLSSDLQDAYRTSGGIWGPTFPSAWPLVRIDYIIASRHWLVGDVEVGPDLPPDHRPVIGRLALRE